MAEQDTPRIHHVLRDLTPKATEKADPPPRDPASEARRLRGLIRAIVSKGPYIFDPRDADMREGKVVLIGRCFWCGSGVEGAHKEANHDPACAWLALETEAEEA